MSHHVRKHHRATLRHIAELRLELDGAIRDARQLADEAPRSTEFADSLESISALHARIAAARQLAITLNRMLPALDVRLVPPTPQRLPTPRPHHARPWAKVVRMAAFPARERKTPT